MEAEYAKTAKMLKALSDIKRLQIIDMLSCGELCACRILEAFSITQPTLSHDLKVLKDANLITDRREGKNTFYALNAEALDQLEQALNRLFHEKADCPCRQTTLEARCS